MDKRTPRNWLKARSLSNSLMAWAMVKILIVNLAQQKSGINTQNIIIKDEAEQLKRTGKTVQEEIAAIKTDITTESAQSQSGKLENRFNKDDVQKELDFQREVTEKFGPNVAEAGSLLANKFGEEAKAKRHEAAIALEEAEKAKAENNNEN